MNARNERKVARRNSKNRTETGQWDRKGPAKAKAKLPKTHQDYWFSRLRKRTYVDGDGKAVEIPTWQVRLFYVGKDGWFNLGTANQKAAAVKARDIYIFLKANGWESAVQKFKPDSGLAHRINLTVGEYLRAVDGRKYLTPGTFFNYRNCFRTIVSEAFGLKSDNSRFDYRNGGNQKWAERVDRIRLDRVTPARVLAWQQKRLQQAGHSPAVIASAKRTINSYVRGARSLFTKDIRKQLKGLQLPLQLPFQDIEILNAGSTKYISKINANALVVAAKKDLKVNHPEAYKAFLLALFAGMRKKEVDLVEWQMLDFQNNVINLEETEWLRLKTDESTGQIAISAEIMAELREFKPLSKSAFVITSSVTVTVGNQKKKRTHVRLPRNDSARPYYRCKPVFKQLMAWLRSKGIKANKPMHELRKEVGAIIATKHGIYAASQFLRHGDITTTARHYAQHKTPIALGLADLLDQPLAIVTEKKAV